MTDNRHSHATVILDGKAIPLIGIPRDATLQECHLCHDVFHISQIVLDGKGVPYCRKCHEPKP